MIPLRQCMGCRERLPKGELLRVVRSPEGDVSVDLTGKKPGRGAYICKKAACMKRIKKSKALDRSLKETLPEEVWEALEGLAHE